jgi:hypothetical protein
MLSLLIISCVQGIYKWSELQMSFAEDILLIPYVHSFYTHMVTFV